MAWPKGKSRKQTSAKVDQSQTTKPKLKPRPDWDAPSGADPLAKFKRKSVEWADYSGEDRLSIPADVLDRLGREGLDLAWIAETCMGQSLDYQVSQHTRNGWVRVEEADGIVDGPVDVDGLHLYCRPLAISQKARDHDRRKSADAVSKVRIGLMGGDIPGVTLDTRHPSALRTNKMNKTYEPIAIPGDE